METKNLHLLKSTNELLSLFIRYDGNEIDKAMLDVLHEVNMKVAIIVQKIERIV